MNAPYARRLRAVDLRIARLQRDLVATRGTYVDPAPTWARLASLGRHRVHVADMACIEARDAQAAGARRAA